MNNVIDKVRLKVGRKDGRITLESSMAKGGLVATHSFHGGDHEKSWEALW